jgi:DNA-binding HxlR family transcriptional regulator
MAPNRSPRNPQTCDRHLARAFEFLGKRWNGVLIGTLSVGPASFAELARVVPGISESVLSDRLSELTAAGLVRREVVEGPPVGVVYHVTPAGLALAPALGELARWAHENLPEASPAPSLPAAPKPVAPAAPPARSGGARRPSRARPA